ncbi:hypothetical protein GCM10029963_23670 [Micromonospora andamanensis]|uniref:hypothetical protein n=1 Tax=Micromonospora andamanensis TaxID=1287068 RepID=UPI00194F0078|nr:hypothetical protein [Micromonospora andamanensis]GIJ38268.1 hypothetical protein Vwe01_15930 [Micromonospora andamanensis]
MPLLRIHLDSDRTTARRVLQLHQAGRTHHESREAARAQVWRQGHTPAGDPVFVGITNGRRNVQLLYDVEVYSGTAG